MALVFMTILLSSKDGFGQEKLERESRINSEEVPVTSLLFVDSLNFTRKVKWYREEGLAGVSIEAKSKKEGQKISVEFDSTGNIEDIEIQVEWKTLSDGLKDRITTQLDQECLRYKIDRKSTRLNSSNLGISYAVFCLKKKKKNKTMKTK